MSHDEAPRATNGDRPPAGPATQTEPAAPAGPVPAVPPTGPAEPVPAARPTAPAAPEAPTPPATLEAPTPPTGPAAPAAPTAATRPAATAAPTESEAPAGTAAPEAPAPPTGPPAPEAPHLDFDGTTPYEDYVRAEVLTHLQQPLSDDPGEMVFLVTTQVMELWFTVIVHEWETAARALREDDVPAATAALKRSVRELEALNASWHPLSALTPAQFNSYRGALGEGSGFQSAMYRRMEFLLGEKSASMLVPHRGAPRVHAELDEALRAPSLYDEVLRLLDRRGHRIPADVLHREPTARYEPSSQVEDVWAALYAAERPAGSHHPAHPPGDGPRTPADTPGTTTAEVPPAPADPELLRLGETLTDVAELVWRWRNDHLSATRRAMGSKQGTGGSAGVAWLEKRAAKTVFPELWTARSRV